VAKIGGRESFPELYASGSRAHTQQPGAGELVRVAEGGKLHRREGKTHFPHEL
jgi:hypothetical protein